MDRWPAFSITSWTRDCCSWKSGWSSSMCLQQHVSESGSHFLHFPWRFWTSNPHSRSTFWCPLADQGNQDDQWDKPSIEKPLCHWPMAMMLWCGAKTNHLATILVFHLGSHSFMRLAGHLQNKQSSLESCQPLSVLGTQVHVPSQRLGWSFHTTVLMLFSLWTQILVGESDLPALQTVPQCW